MSLRRSPRLSSMIQPSSKAISVVKPRVLRLAVFASRRSSGSRPGNVFSGSPFHAQLSLDRLDEVAAERAEIGDVDARPEHGDEGAAMGEKETLLALDPDEVQVPVLVARRQVAQGELATVQQVEHLLGATHDHTANLPTAGSRFTLRPCTRGSARRGGRGGARESAERPA